jgi:prepilin-type N-terminal cleavage/methylation domain-containing protein
MFKIPAPIKNNTSSKGFSLIELLIVISIMAILAVVSVTVYSNVQKNARNSARRADVDSIIKAIETAKNPNNSTYGAIAIDGAAFQSGSVPRDPSSDQVYCVSPTGAATSAGAALTAAFTSCPTASGWVSINGTSYTVPASATSVRVCASLEGGNPYCKVTVQ